ncbi:MAG: hypothetical protein CSB44_10855 [Gammaproteobacteria bacterium]|nr:MAG: hypothetical protein CSB44_10855 [Gammaproteobacteria bacterium]PIE36878.1 MAG: hypothetical protein CSA54_02950 [Gammaproteobacteria bacterium]
MGVTVADSPAVVEALVEVLVVVLVEALVEALAEARVGAVMALGSVIRGTRKYTGSAHPASFISLRLHHIHE